MDRELFGKYAADGLLAGTNDEIAEGLIQRRTARWQVACHAGRCAYTDLPATKKFPPPVDSDTCSGWVGTRDDAAGVWRYARCDRFLAWIQRRNEYVRASEGKPKRERVPEEPF